MRQVQQMKTEAEKQEQQQRALATKLDRETAAVRELQAAAKAGEGHFKRSLATALSKLFDRRTANAVVHYFISHQHCDTQRVAVLNKFLALELHRYLLPQLVDGSVATAVATKHAESCWGIKPRSDGQSESGFATLLGAIWEKDPVKGVYRLKAGVTPGSVATLEGVKAKGVRFEFNTDGNSDASSKAEKSTAGNAAAAAAATAVEESGEPAAKKARVEKTVKDPNEPKRNLSAYFIFTGDKRPAVMEEIKAANDGKCDVSKVGKKLGEMWKEVSEEDRKPYDVRAAADKERYAAEMANYTPPAGLAKKEKAAPKKRAAAAGKKDKAPEKWLSSSDDSDSSDSDSDSDSDAGSSPSPSSWSRPSPALPRSSWPWTS